MTLLFSALHYSRSFFSDENMATGRSKSILHQFSSISGAGSASFLRIPGEVFSITLIGPSWDMCTSLPNPSGQEIYYSHWPGWAISSTLEPN